MKPRLIFLFLLLSLVSPVGITGVVLAAETPLLPPLVPIPQKKNPCPAKDPDKIYLVNPIGSTEQNPCGETDWYRFLGRAVQIGLGILGSVTLAVFMYGGFVWLTSGGNEDRVSHGLKVMLYAALGVFIIFGSYAILSTVFRGLTSP